MIRPVLRMITVAALRELTFAQSRVYDSDNSPLIDALSAETSPYITVFTDSDNRIEIDSMDVYATQRNLSLVLEFGLASAVTVEKGDKTIHFPQTDPGMEAMVDIVEDQAIAALIGDPTSQWGELFKSIVTRVYRMNSMRGGSSDRGTRWAARKLTMVCQTIADPIPGLVLGSGHVIKRFVALARANDMDAEADVVEKMLETNASQDYRNAQAWLGLSQRGIESTGTAPLPQGDEVPTPFDDEENSGVEWDEDLETQAPGPPESFP